MASTIYDIAVVGATPAGYSAAYYLARKKFSVLLVDCPRQPTECPLADWAPADFFALEGLPRGLAKACQAQEFRHICYHNAALDKRVQYTGKGRSGYLVEHAAFEKALKAAAVQAKVKIVHVSDPPAIQLLEDSVCLLANRQLTARMLLVAHGRPADALGDLALPARSVPPSPLVVAGIDVPLTGKAAGGDFNGCVHVVELAERSELGLFFRINDTLHLRVISSSIASGNRAAELSGMVANLQSAGIMPPKVSLARARGAVWHPPAGVALEMETHVAKRCLLIGTAGGFAESITGQTLAPTVQSALLAAEVVADAVARDGQETLMRFKNIWRKELADYLRPPTTSLRLLLPLLFANQNIVNKFTRALVFGENI